MATKCVALARGRRMRLTRLDSCSEPVAGPTGQLVTSGYVSVGISPNYQDPEDIQQPNANGDLCIDDRSNAIFRWFDLTMVFCLVDPDAMNIITGNPLVVDDATPTPNTVGFRVDSGLTGTANFALEIWSGVTGQTCTTGLTQYGYWLFPWVLQAQLGEWTVENGALTMTLTARTSGNSTWGVGPYLVRDDAVTGTDEPLLTAIGPNQQLHYETVTLAPPAAVCGAQVLTIT